MRYRAFRKPFENSGTGYKALSEQHPQAYLLYVEDCCSLSNAVDGMHIFKRKLDDDIYQLIRNRDNLFRLFIAEEALCAICF